MSSLNEARAAALGLSSAKANDELGVFMSLDFLTDCGTAYINKGLEPDARRAIARVRDIGIAAALQGMEMSVFASLISLGRMAEAARGQKLLDTGMSILYSFCSIGKAAAGQEMRAAVRVAAAYLGEALNSAPMHNLKREAMAAALAFGNLSRPGDGHSCVRAPENGGLPPAFPGSLFSPPRGNEAAIFQKEPAGTQGIIVGSVLNNPIYMPSLAEYEFRGQGFKNFENIIIKAAHSLENIRFEAGEKYLLSYILMAKIELETSSDSEFTNEADAMDR